jgi:hypothetical protein
VRFGDLEGLVHISEMAWQRIENPRDLVKVGQKVECKIIAIDNNTTVPANGKAMSQYAVKVCDCTFTIKTRWYQNLAGESYAFERCRFNNTTGSAAGYGNGAGIFHGLGGGKTLYRYCEFNLDMSHGDGSMHGVFYTQASADEFHFYNCTYYDARTNDNLVGILTMNGSAPTLARSAAVSASD